MANDHLKKDLKDILKIKGKVTKERPVKGLIKKEAFIRFIENYKYANDRALMLKTEHAIDFVNFEEPFVQAIEALLELHFNKHQKQIIEWWLYEDRKSTRLNSSHLVISYAVFCLKKKKNNNRKILLILHPHF